MLHDFNLTYYSSIILGSSYYSQNYAGILASPIAICGTDQKYHQLSSKWDQLTVWQIHPFAAYCSSKPPNSDTTGSAWREIQSLSKILAKLRERFYWPGMITSVHEWCQTCHSCMSHKRPQQTRRGALENIKAGYPLEIMAMDIVGPLPTSKSGNKYILVISDYFTKWAEGIWHSQIKRQ